MRYVKNFGIFWYDFIVGDDWTIAAGIVVIMVVSYLLEQMGIVAWWVFFLVVFGLLWLTLKGRSAIIPSVSDPMQSRFARFPNREPIHAPVRLL